VGLSKKSDRIK